VRTGIADEGFSLAKNPKQEKRTNDREQRVRKQLREEIIRAMPEHPKLGAAGDCKSCDYT